MTIQTIHSHDSHTHDHSGAQGHAHDHGHEHRSGLLGWFDKLFGAHSHDHSDLAGDEAFASNELGIRTVWLALVALAVTSVLQLAIVAMSGSVSLLADTAHNIGDAANSIPLLIAFYVGRRVASKRFTYGYGRGEDVAGIFIILSIFVSAGIVFWESFQRLFDPQPLQNIGWVAAAGIIGFIGNELVAVMQIRVGKRIGSEALISDGLHARTDGLTSLAVLVAAGGAWLGFPLVDPIVGILIGIAILFISWDATKRIWRRLMDSVEPELTESVERVVENRPNIAAIIQLRLRYVGHKLHGDMRLQLSDASLATATIADVRHQLGHDVPQLADLVIEVA